MLATISDDRSKAFGLGALEHLVKPVDRQHLIEALERRSFTTKVQERGVHERALRRRSASLERHVEAILAKASLDFEALPSEIERVVRRTS